MSGSSNRPISKLTFFNSDSNHCCESSSYLDENISLCKLCLLYVPQEDQMANRNSSMVRSSRLLPFDVRCFVSRQAFENLLKNQEKQKTYSHQFQSFGQRNRILKNIKLLVDEYQFSPSTFYVALSYSDSILTNMILSDDLLKLFSYCCCMISAKVNDSQFEIPCLENMIEFFDGMFDGKTIKNMENSILQALDYNLIVQTPYFLMNVFLTIGVVNQRELSIYGFDADELLDKIERDAFELIDLINSNYEFNRFSFCLRALAALFCSRKANGLAYSSRYIYEIIGIPWSVVQPVVVKLVAVIGEIDSLMLGTYSDIFEDLNDFGENDTFIFKRSNNSSFLHLTNEWTNIRNEVNPCEVENQENACPTKTSNENDKQQNNANKMKENDKKHKAISKNSGQPNFGGKSNDIRSLKLIGSAKDEKENKKGSQATFSKNELMRI